ncbi:hypothetical protein [Pseudomonas phage K4]|uniref:hypothetical protein n=1 Tax=Pseudomonas phage O4 TaxID=1784982 RepID=UPI00078DC0F2|nr:hypothetical protein BJD45_gp47 [Pseudomonas phage O4]AMO43522.1 hypothetical protein O4_47 [Pseudomonas phage O4]ATG86282.1 hypothetical protein [Pseudomonas phage IME180]QWS69981.1 hypothetical protein [Pseudomonas phage K4]
MTYRYDSVDVTYLLDCSLSTIKTYIEELIEKYGEEAALDFEKDYDDSIRLYVSYKRLETEAEREAREKAKARFDEGRRRMYEELKKEFGE